MSVVVRTYSQADYLSSPRFISGHKFFLANRERLRLAQSYPTMLWNVESLDGLIQFQRSQPVYVIFQRVKKQIENEKNVRKFSNSENNCLSKNFYLLHNVVKSDSLEIDFEDSSEFLELLIHFDSYQIVLKVTSMLKNLN